VGVEVIGVILNMAFNLIILGDRTIPVGPIRLEKEAKEDRYLRQMCLGTMRSEAQTILKPLLYFDIM